jgi:pyruvate/2-oxoglutarate dehydrogenase complex dihydrolipoamide acyltransferase (E2) component
VPPTTPTKVFVPNTPGIPNAPGTVVACHKRRGDPIDAEEMLFEIRYADLDAEVLAPVTGTLIELHVATGDTVSVGWPLAAIAAEAEGNASWTPARFARALVERAPFVIAIALSAPALLWPAWLAVVLIGSLLLVGIERTWTPGRHLEPADVFMLPLGVAVGAGRWIRERASQLAPLAGILPLMVWLAVAITGTAIVGGALWLISYGADGLAAAIRLAEFGHAARMFAFLASLSFIRRGLSVPARKAYLSRELSNVPTAALTGATLVALTWAIMCAVAIPRDAWWPASNLDAAASSMPLGLRSTVREWKRSLAETEARAVVNCAAQRGLGGWLPPVALLRPDNSVAVAVNYDRASPPDDRSLAVLMLALQNQLSPNASVVVIHTTKPRARLRFELFPTGSPVTEVGPITERVAPNRQADAHLRAVKSVPEHDIKVALRCSAVAF